MFHYRVYGHVLESGAPIPELLPAGPEATPDLRVDFSTFPHRRSSEGYTLRLLSQERLACGEPLASVYDGSAAYILRHTGTADFELSKCGGHVRVYACRDASPEGMRLLLLGGVLSFALELRGIPCLHASAVVVEDQGVAFLGDAHAGKSTLAASFLQTGHALLTDDILPLSRKDGQVWAAFGYPQMRMWPQEVQHFLGSYEDLAFVHPAYSKRRVPIGPEGFGAFCATSQPLSCIYLPERKRAQGTTRIEITPTSPRDAVIELVRHSFVASIVEQLGLQPQRLDVFANLVQQVPMRRLVYPSGFEHLPRVREAILQDLAALS